ncbi:MAG: TIGR00159 family protein, partial [Selenomonadales bacterium]|nr:TIGR00159 family protein [Selenomonadales bacterium]
MQGIVNTVGPLDVIDILIVAVIIYKIYGLLKDTRAIT